MENVYEKKSKCCGCSACYSICPKSAISMEKDEKGFLYPKIDKDKCINCGLCVRTCPLKNYKKEMQEYKIYAVKNKNLMIRINSSSGGIFYEICKWLIENKQAYIYGATYDENLSVIHSQINTIQECKKIMGSKYVQSDLKNTFRSIKEQLENKKYVLFSGTPCQIAGLKQFLQKDYEQLITIDIVCHGVPSPSIFDDYKKQQEQMYNSKIKNINFRYKTEDNFQNMYIEFESGDTYLCSSKEDLYYKLYDIGLRESCYECKFANMNRVGDITIGDFWKVDNLIKGFNDSKGVSLVIINTSKGRKILEKISQNLEIKLIETNETLQPNLKAPTMKNKKSSRFWKDYQKRGFQYISNKYIKISTGRKIKRKIVKTIKKLVKKED